MKLKNKSLCNINFGAQNIDSWSSTPILVLRL